MNTYISDVQKDTMSSYPLTISAETVDLTSLMGQRRNMLEEKMDNNTDNETVTDGIHADYSDIENSESVNSSVIENNLTNF